MFELENGGVIVLYAVSAVIIFPSLPDDVPVYAVKMVGGEAFLPEEEGKRLIEALKDLIKPMTILPQMMGPSG